MARCPGANGPLWTCGGLARTTLWFPRQASMIWLLALQLVLSPAQQARSPAQSEATPTQHYENAKQDLAEQKLSQAVGEVDAALHESPYMVPALVLKARLAILARRPDVAKSCLITAITADPTSEEAQFYLGLLFYTQNDFQSAIAPLQTAHTLSPDSPIPVFYLAMTHEALGDEAMTLALYLQAEQLSPERTPQRAEIFVAHGRFLLSLGRTEDGIEKERQAIEIDPKSRDAHYELAKGLDHAGDFKDAAPEGERALTLPAGNASDAQIHFLLAALYRKLNQPDLAKAHLEKFQAATKVAPR
jgi:tetratricopeptide (TPR) repeat protein